MKRVRFEVSGYFNGHQHFKREFGFFGAVKLLMMATKEIKFKRVS